MRAKYKNTGRWEGAKPCASDFQVHLAAKKYGPGHREGAQPLSAVGGAATAFNHFFWGLLVCEAMRLRYWNSEEALIWSAAPPFFEAPPLSEGRGSGSGAWAGRVAVAGRQVARSQRQRQLLRSEMRRRKGQSSCRHKAVVGCVRCPGLACRSNAMSGS
jgi:hypothetical protein